MAGKNDKAPTAAAEAGKKSILGAYLPEGMSEKDIVLTGQLLPQYLGNEILARLAESLGVRKVEDLTAEQCAAIVPIVGLMDRVEVMPIQERKSGDDFAPFSIIVRDVKETITCFRGPKVKRVDVVVNKGEAALFPITGQSTVNKQLHDAIRDVENVYLFAARPVGAEVVNDQPSAMVKWQIEVAKIPGAKRSDRGAEWALPAWYAVVNSTGDLTASIRNKEHLGLLRLAMGDGIDVTPIGNVINRATGEVIARIGDGGRVLPPPKELQQQVS